MFQNQNKKQASPISVEVRRQGVFREVATAKTVVEGLLKGKNILEGTAAASFRLRGVSEPQTPKTNLNVLGSDFAISKTETNVFIQKRGKRIKSAGEKREITSKGIFAQKTKNKTKNMWRF